MNLPKKQKVIVAMSGGIDSSTAALLLKKADFEVIGIFFKLFDSPNFKLAENKARKAAKILKIPILILDLRKEFEKKVIEHFLKEYEQGRTPNPCIVCNKEIKFKTLFKKACEINADFVATGHYAKIKVENSSPSSRIIYKLLRAKDIERDQSYFLWTLTQKQLKHILFPVGGYTKTQVRYLAKKFKLPGVNTLESREICFIQRSVDKFLSIYFKPKCGEIINRQGRVVGRHQGLFFYTIGQRKGIVPFLQKQEKAKGPYYVFKKDLKRNILFVTKNQKDLYKKEVILKKANWIAGKEPKLPLKIKAKIRYQYKPSSAIVIRYKPKSKYRRYKAIFTRAQKAITSGQSIVFYKGQEVVGGGVIL